MRVGVDTGGTFTDVVAGDGRIVKVPSTPDDPAEAVAAGLAALGGGGDEGGGGGGGGAAGRPELLAHGTTVATNALLERRGAAVALVTTAGMADVIEIGRQDRPSLYDPWADRPVPLVPRGSRLEVGGRLDGTGREVEALDPDGVPPVPLAAQVVAVCLLHADLDPSHERAVAAVLEGRGHRVVCSHQVSPEFREYERTLTTVVDAYLGPVCAEYLGRLATLAGEVVVLTSAGGLVGLAEAVARPAALLLSGPAGGARAAAAAAATAGFPDAVSFDMGGTSTDVCLVLGGAPAPAAERTVAGLPVRLPSLDIHTIGAGGGSVARVDPGGALVVGPRSAGARPGPACYGLGGTEATVTDADYVAGRIPWDATLPGIGRLDPDAALAALDALGVTAEGVIEVVDAAMVQAVRAVTVARGVDPRDLALVAFGGAGPLHACAMAAALDMAAVVVPPRAGVLSAAGLLGSPRQAVVVRSWPTPGDQAGLSEARFGLARAAARRVVGATADAPARVMLDPRSPVAAVTVAGVTVEVELAVDCRYAGQSHELTVASPAAFEDEHRRRNGYARRGADVEVVAVRAAARLPPPVPPDRLPVPADPVRTGVAGPKVVAEPDCTVWVAPGWEAEVGPGGSWVIRR